MPKRITRKIKSKAKRVVKKSVPKSKIKKTISKAKRPYTKVKNVAKKLNRKPNKKVIEKNVKKFVRKALKRYTKLSKTKIRSTFKGLDKINIRTGSKAELKEYIKKATSLVNQAYPSMNKASQAAMKEARKIFGKGDNGDFLTTFIGSRERKDLLVEKASMLEAIINGDGVSTIGLIKDNMKLIKSYNTFKRGPVGSGMKGLTFEEWHEMVNVAGDVEGVLGEYYSANIFTQFHKYKDSLGITTVGDLIMEVVKEHPDPGLEGWSTSDMTKAIIEKLKNELERKK